MPDCMLQPGSLGPVPGMVHKARPQTGLSEPGYTNHAIVTVPLK